LVLPVNEGETSLKWFKVCRESELKAGQARSIVLLARPYAVFNVDGELYGIEAACRHAKANLAAGKLDGHVVECFMHGWRYNVKTGECLTKAYGFVNTYAVKRENDWVWIGVEWPPAALSDQ
jgi:nitrite reductase/ring-hydroxylating ferredoxin subunit